VFFVPVFKGLNPWETIERKVQFKRVEVLAVKGKPITFWKILRVKIWLPVVVIKPGTSYMEFYHGVGYAKGVPCI